MAQSVGQISMDLVLGKNQFKQQLNTAVNQSVKSATKNATSTVSSSFGQLGKLAAAAFSLTAIVKFGAECVQLGSDLAEVQNVVEVAFGSMSGEADKFAKSALKNFGLSETVAKRYMGTFGAMASSFGYSTQDALAMSEKLTGLVGDVASFYNYTSDIAYTKLKAVFTGETEGLKDLGVVMTQTALDEFALANGFGKVTAKMTEQEKVALRMAFVTKQLDQASGDFVRTQGSWANQSRILKETLDALKTQLGQAFIQALTPVIKMINTLMSRLLTLAEVTNQLTAKLFGKQEMNGLGAAAEAAGEVADNTEGIGDSAESAAKKVRKSLMGFDQLNRLADSTEDSGKIGTAAISIPDISSGNEEKAVDNLTNKYGALKEVIKDLGNEFKKGFSNVFDKSEVQPIIDNIGIIRKSLGDIFTSDEVQNSANKMADKVAYALGQVAGSAASIGTTIGINLTGSTAKYLDENKGFISEKISSMLDTTGEFAGKAGDYSAAIADIFTVFRSESATEIGSNIEEFFINPFLTLQDTLLKFKTDVFDVITGPIVENSDEIKEAFQGILDAFAPASDKIASTMTDICNSFSDTYDNYIHPFMTSVKDGFTDIGSSFLEAWNTYMKPVLDSLSERLGDLWENHIGPLAERLMSVFGKVTELIKILWDNVLSPFIGWLVENIVPELAPIIEFIWQTVMTTYEFIADKIEGLLQVFEGILDFIIGVFTGDWERALDGLKEIALGAFKALFAGVKQIVNRLVDALNLVFQFLANTANKIKIPDWVPEFGGKGFNIDIPKIPHLAQGGYVRANTPQLAMIGDNKREGEIVAPESKITEAVSAAMGPISNAISKLADSIAEGGNAGDITIPIFLDGNMLDKVIINAQNRQAIRSGGR